MECLDSETFPLGFCEVETSEIHLFSMAAPASQEFLVISHNRDFMLL